MLETEEKFIHSIRVGNTEIVDHDEKTKLIHEHFSSIIGQKMQRSCTINWEELHLPWLNMQGLDMPFSEQEIWAAVKESPAEKAPGPDGFKGKFFRSCWHLIKVDILRVFNKFYHLAGHNFSALNEAVIALLPKKNGASEISHYRPISLIHSVVKLITKVLSMWLASAIQGVISPEPPFNRENAYRTATCMSRGA